MRWLRALALALCLVWNGAASAAELALHLRIAWGGGTDRIWQATIRVSQGKLSDPRSLGIEADQPGAVWLDGHELHVAPASSRSFDGVDVLVRGDTQSVLHIELAAESEVPSQHVEIPLAELVEGVHNNTLDESGNRLSVTRAPGDRLRVEFDRSHLVFTPGETFALRVRPAHLGAAAAGARVQATLSTSPGGHRTWSDEFSPGEDGAATVTLTMPREEGVYDLSLAAVPSSRIKQKFRLPLKSLVERKVQLVVVDPRPLPAGGDPPTAKVLEINPAHARWWERLAALPALPGFRKGPLGSGETANWEHPTLGPLVQLGPGGEEPQVSWEAYPLPINHPGQVHVLEIEYPTDVPQTLGISLVEPNAAGAVLPIGLDSGVYVTDEEASATPRLARHRVVFWPKTKTPLVLITNRRPGARAVYGKITVLSAPQSQLAMLNLARGEHSGHLPPAFADGLRGERLWAGYLDRPLVPENFGAPEAFDALSRRSLDDWGTFHHAGTRLIAYLRHVGYNGLMLSVLSDGSSIYPSTLLEPTPRYDTGAFFASGQDPKRKDVLELYFRLFDRERLKLIPALHFATPLPALEALRRAGGEAAVGIEWIGADGQATLAAAPRQGLAPYYNLLDERVQQAMLDVAREVIGRYADHESFAGVALQLSPDSYAQLPAAEFGCDDHTIARFERETGNHVPGSGEGRFAARARYLAGPGRTAWLQWRAGIVAGFHQRLEAELAAASPGARLYLAGGTMLEDPSLQQRLRPSLTRRAKIDEAFQELGISPAAYQQSTQISLLRPLLLRPSLGPPPLGAAENELYQSRELDALFTAAGQRGAIFYHEPQRTRLPGFDLASPFGAANTYAWLVSQMSPSQQRNRRRFVHSLATSDTNEMFDGGWLLPLGQELATRRLIAAYRTLPAAPFKTVAGEHQPVTIRTLTHEGRSYIYLVNDSPWPVGVTLNLDAAADCRLEMLGESGSAGPLQRTTGRTTWQVSLEPYDLVAARFSAPQVGVFAATVSLPDGVRETLETRIADLVARVRTLGHPLLDNPGFERPLVDQQIPGWSARVPAGGRVALDTRHKSSGTRSVLLATKSAPVSIVTAPLTPPNTGRVTVEVMLRTVDAEQPPSLKIALEGQSASGPFEPQGVIDRVGATAQRPGDWVPYTFPVDLPEGGLSSLRVRFELLTPGEVWIDDVQIRAFSENELIVLSKINSMASLHFEKAQYADCIRVLEGYWPQFLVANVALNTPLAQRPTMPEQPAVEPAKSPSMFDTMKSYLPSFLR